MTDIILRVARAGDDRHTRLAAWLRFALPGSQLGGEIVNALTSEPDRSPGANQSRSCRATLLFRAPFGAAKPTLSPLVMSRLWIER